MATEVIMPQMGESIFEGTITKWLKKVGDPVRKDEPLFEISTDKVDAEIPSPTEGILADIFTLEGETVKINTVVALIGGEEDKVASESTLSAPAETAASARVEVVMPQMGESIFEGTITKWLKQVGESVEKDEPLFEISTDKVDAEIPSPQAGILTEIRVQLGETVQINTVVAVIGGVPGAAPEPVQEPVEEAPAPPEPEIVNTDEKVRSSPLVRRIAREHHLDLRLISGTGANGRITKEDALKFLAKHGEGAPTPIPAEETAPSPGELVPLSRMRSIIAQRMVESVHTAPHVYTVYKIDMTRVVKLRERQRAAFEQRHGVKLTYMPFIAAAAIQALAKFPIVNASLEATGAGDAIRYHNHIHLGIAVALEWGLIVPVIREAEERTFLGLAQAIGSLAERARAKKLKPDEAQGSTFTLTNSGVFGGEFGTPILNQPESAILAIGGLRKEPVVLTDSEGNDTIGIRWMQHYCLGFDHRLIDGADAGKFMSELKKHLESWSSTLD